MSGSSWKVAYADFVTAMMAFFLLMWILNMVPPEKKSEMAVYFMDPGAYDSRSTVIDLNSPPSPGSGGEKDATELTPEEVNLLAVNRFLTEQLQEQLAARKIFVRATEAGVLLRTSTALNFEQNAADLGPEGDIVLRSVVQVMRRFKVNLDIGGHTDSAEDGSPRLRGKWELSAARAAAVTAFIVDQDIAPSMIRSNAFANFRPIVPDSEEEPNPINRRVEFFFYTPDTKPTNMAH